MKSPTRQLVLIGCCWMLSLASASCSTEPASAAKLSAFTATTTDVEQARLPVALAVLPNRLKNVSRVAQTQANLSISANDVDRLVAQANSLWQQAVQETQAGLIDDRPLYWQRLASQQQIQRTCSGDHCEALTHSFETASRGADDLIYANSDALRILITGFDPFALDRNIRQTNPSGVIALQLDGRTLEYNATAENSEHQAKYKAQLQSLIFPVRFADFDAGMVEQLLSPLLESNAVDVIITLSMGRDGFDLERFPGRRRATTATDNRNRQTGASATNPLIPLLNDKPLQGPEFVEFSLPAAALLTQQTPYPVADNHQVRTLEDGAITPSSLGELVGKTAVAGSGGTYLSNEISYRSVLLGKRINPKLPVGHIHLPRLTGYDEETLLRISEQLQQMLRHAIPALGQASNQQAN